VNLTNDAARRPAPGLVPLSPAAQSVVDAIIASGGRPVIVGGSVRDALLGARDGIVVDPKDIDIEVYGVDDHPHLVDALKHLGRVDEQGVRFGVVAATVDGESFDISLPRRDSKTGAGHGGFEVIIDPNLPEDIAFSRRDFTLNALGWDPVTEELIDHFGGEADLYAGVLRHPGPAFVDDPLRVIRGAQFAARFGFTMAPETVELSKSIAHTYPELDKNGVWQEWRKIARRGIHITSALTVLDDTGWLQHFPELADTKHVEQDEHWHPEGNVLTHLGLAANAAATAAERDGLPVEDREVAVLAALFHDLGKSNTTVREVVDGQERITSQGHQETGVPMAEKLLRDIGAPQALIDKVGPIIGTHMNHISTVGKPSGAAVRRLIRTLDNGGTGPSIYDWARVVDADLAGRGPGAKQSPTAQWLEVAEYVGPVARKSLLTGGDLAAAGYAPSPGWSLVIDAAVEAQDDGLFDDAEGARAWYAASGLVPIGFPQRPSNKLRHRSWKWLVDNAPERAGTSPIAGPERFATGS
jgi:tRNA nucleotidyltransferase (CCA-adding enzyme)